MIVELFSCPRKPLTRCLLTFHHGLSDYFSSEDLTMSDFSSIVSGRLRVELFLDLASCFFITQLTGKLITICVDGICTILALLMVSSGADYPQPITSLIRLVMAKANISIPMVKTRQKIQFVER